MHMTDEYAAQHFHKMGWMWGRLEVMKEEKTWGDLRANLVEKDLREKIAQEIEALMCDPWNCNKYPEVNLEECTRTNIKWELAASIARGQR